VNQASMFALVQRMKTCLNIGTCECRDRRRPQPAPEPFLCVRGGAENGNPFCSRRPNDSMSDFLAATQQLWLTVSCSKLFNCNETNIYCSERSLP
jgi:hypothetical protein